MAFILFAIGPDVHSKAVSAVVFEGAVIGAPVGESEQALAVHFVVFDLARVYVPVFPDDAS